MHACMHACCCGPWEGSDLHDAGLLGPACGHALLHLQLQRPAQVINCSSGGCHSLLCRMPGQVSSWSEAGLAHTFAGVPLCSSDDAGDCRLRRWQRVLRGRHANRRDIPAVQAGMPFLLELSIPALWALRLAISTAKNFARSKTNALLQDACSSLEGMPMRNERNCGGCKGLRMAL